MKTSEYTELEIGLKNELINKETLVYMLNRIKSDNISKAPAILEIRRKLQAINHKLHSLEKKYIHIISKITELDKNIGEEESSYIHLLSTKNNLVSEKSSSYKERIKLKLCITQEQERNIIQTKQNRDSKKLKELESKLHSFKDMEILEEEILSIESYCHNEEEKFKTIQKVTNIKYIGDMLSHYKYLMDNKQRLLDSVSSALIQIERLNADRIEMSEELNDLKYQTDNHKILENSVIEEVKLNFKDKIKHIEDYEEKLEKMQKVIIVALNIFSRVAQMVGIEKKIGKVRIENLFDSMRLCYQSLGKIVEQINDDQNSSNSLNFTLSDTQSNHLHINL